MFLLAELYIFLVFLRKTCQRRFIFNFWRNSWPVFYCTMFYHYSTRLWTCFW